ncbi:MAG: hypothetical protein M1837_004094 [Sclerophora amabilis]|nr:MAG: hypothetical protein M1837_004094 [Sclerophora amabilis]
MLTTSRASALVTSLALFGVTVTGYRNGQCWGTEVNSDGRLTAYDAALTESCCNTAPLHHIEVAQPASAKYFPSKDGGQCAIGLVSKDNLHVDHFTECCNASNKFIRLEAPCCKGLNQIVEPTTDDLEKELEDLKKRLPKDTFAIKSIFPPIDEEYGKRNTWSCKSREVNPFPAGQPVTKDATASDGDSRFYVYNQVACPSFREKIGPPYDTYQGAWFYDGEDTLLRTNGENGDQARGWKEPNQEKIVF